MYSHPPPPNYECAIKDMSGNDNNIFNDKKIKEYLTNLTLSYYPSISKLKKLTNNFSKHFSNFKDDVFS